MLTIYLNTHLLYYSFYIIIHLLYYTIGYYTLIYFTLFYGPVHIIKITNLNKKLTFIEYKNGSKYLGWNFFNIII